MQAGQVLQSGTDGGQVTVSGKGSETRVVLLPNTICASCSASASILDLGAPVFPCRRGGGHLHSSAIERIVIKRDPNLFPLTVSGKGGLKTHNLVELVDRIGGT